MSLSVLWPTWKMTLTRCRTPRRNPRTSSRRPQARARWAPGTPAASPAARAAPGGREAQLPQTSSVTPWRTFDSARGLSGQREIRVLWDVDETGRTPDPRVDLAMGRPRRPRSSRQCGRRSRSRRHRGPARRCRRSSDRPGSAVVHGRSPTPAVPAPTPADPPQPAAARPFERGRTRSWSWPFPAAHLDEVLDLEAAGPSRRSSRRAQVKPTPDAGHRSGHLECGRRQPVGGRLSSSSERRASRASSYEKTSSPPGFRIRAARESSDRVGPQQAPYSEIGQVEGRVAKRHGFGVAVNERKPRRDGAEAGARSPAATIDASMRRRAPAPGEPRRHVRRPEPSSIACLRGDSPG